jgi:hypothetical protein
MSEEHDGLPLGQDLLARPEPSEYDTGLPDTGVTISGLPELKVVIIDLDNIQLFVNDDFGCEAELVTRS